MVTARRLAIGVLASLVVVCAVRTAQELWRAHADAQDPCAGRVCAEVRHAFVEAHRTAGVRALIVALVALALLGAVVWWHRRARRVDASPP